jgi:S-DNA-T family DNA segregation ATPase FtsK/SpoIIIE
VATTQKPRTNAKRSTAKSPRTTSRTTKANAGSPVRKAGGELLAGHADDLAAVALILFGIVAGLGTYADAAGPVGRALDSTAGAVLGLTRYLLPAASCGIGIALLVRPDGDQAGDAAPARWLQPVAGGLLLFVAILGILHLAGGQPDLDDGGPALAAAGGAVGVGIGGGLASLVGVWAAGVVLLGLGVLGLVVITGTPLRAAAASTGSGLARVGRPVRGALGRFWQSLFEVGGSDPAVAETEARTPPGSEGDIEVPEWVSAPEPVAVQVPAADPPADAPVAEVQAPSDTTDVSGDGLDEPDDGDADEADGPTQLEIGLGPAAQRSPWKLPQAKLLDRTDAQQVDTAAVEARGRTLEAALAAHGVETRLVGMVVGPTVTRYELELGPGVKVARVTSLNKDIAYAMASPDVRILAPIPGRQAIGVEVPNETRQIVSVGDILSSLEAKEAHHPLEVAIGRDINGRSILANLAKMPHLLIAGATGAGKSSCINSLLTSILMRSTPDQVRMILVDPKRVELGQYNRLPHLLTQVVTSPKKAANALAWAVKEMERRYDLLSEVGFRDIDGYNSAYDRGELEAGPGEDITYSRLPYILVVVDELNDLMMVAARDVEESICRLAQMARAVGIHLVIATQRPSVNVITGVIKANMPARLAFAVSSLADSRVILDQAGAERLVGRGDMLLLDSTSNIPRRIQGSWVSEGEVRKVVAAWRRQAPEVAYDDDGVQGADDAPGGGASMPGSGSGDDDELLEQARTLVVETQLGSTSMLQRKLRVGFARAGRLMDLLEETGVVGPSEGSKARAVLMSPEELEAMRTGSWPGADAEAEGDAGSGTASGEGNPGDAPAGELPQPDEF